MTDKEINIAIAEACPTVAGVWSDGELRWNYKLRPVPTCFDPVNDLNAMHEAEKVLTADDRKMWEYVRQLVATTHGRLYPDCISTWQMIHATARQRAEAFLRTLGKWPATEQASLDKSPPA